MNKLWTAVFAAAVVVASGCAAPLVGDSAEPKRYVEADVVSSVPDGASVPAFNSSAAADAPLLGRAVEQAISTHRHGAGAALVPVPSGEWPRVDAALSTMNTSFVRYGNYTVRVAVVTEQ